MDEKPQARLGALLRQGREIHRLSVRAAATRAQISGTYLSQLEAGSIREPSPHILHNLAKVYGVSYADLMRTAGYVVPENGRRADHALAASPFDIALRTSAPLTDDEREALAEYLAWYRSRHSSHPGNS